MLRQLSYTATPRLTGVKYQVNTNLDIFSLSAFYSYLRYTMWVRTNISKCVIRLCHYVGERLTEDMLFQETGGTESLV
jgi:hypothetical protein